MLEQHRWTCAGAGYPGERGASVTTWKSAMLEKFAGPNPKILFNLEGAAEGWRGIYGAAAGEGDSTQGELLQIQPGLQCWNSIVRREGGPQVPDGLE